MIEPPFPDLLETSRRHRNEHGCGAYPYDKGSLLQVLTAALQPDRIVEVGTAIGYTSVCMATAAPQAGVDTIEMEPVHAELAVRHFADYGVDGRVTSHLGTADDILPTLKSASYELAFFDGFAPTAAVLDELRRLLRPGGFLVCANLTLGGDGEHALGDVDRWMTHSFGETAIAVKR